LWGEKVNPVLVAGRWSLEQHSVLAGNRYCSFLKADEFGDSNGLSLSTGSSCVGALGGAWEAVAFVSAQNRSSSSSQKTLRTV